MTLAVQLRGSFEASFVRICSWLAPAGAALALLTVAAIQPRAAIDGFALDTGALDPLRAGAVALLLFSLVYALALRREEDAFLAHAAGATTAALGMAILVLLAKLVQEPTWSVAGAFLSILAGSLTLGVVVIAMIWGHWYLVNPRLAARPLNEMTLVTLGAIVAETAVTALNAVMPVGRHVASNALLAIALPENPAFWLRVGIGLLFPGVLAYLAYRSSAEGAMTSATGLLYIAVGAVLAGEALGRGLLFVTGAPV